MGGGNELRCIYFNGGLCCWVTIVLLSKGVHKKKIKMVEKKMQITHGDYWLLVKEISVYVEFVKFKRAYLFYFFRQIGVYFVLYRTRTRYQG